MVNSEVLWKLIPIQKTADTREENVVPAPITGQKAAEVSQLIQGLSHLNIKLPWSSSQGLFLFLKTKGNFLPWSFRLMSIM
jgi:hypothetical protein